MDLTTLNGIDRNASYKVPEFCTISLATVDVGGVLSVLYYALRVFSVVYGIVIQFSLNSFKTNS